MFAVAYDFFFRWHHPVCRIHCAIVMNYIYSSTDASVFYYNGSWHVCYAYSLAFLASSIISKDIFFGRWVFLFIYYTFLFNTNFNTIQTYTNEREKSNKHF